MEDYIPRKEAIIAVCRARLPDTTDDGIPIANGKRSVTDCVRRLKEIPAADVRPVPDGGIGEMSDGYHTFNGLYYQRMVLFAALVKAYNSKAWKSWKHEDGEPCFGGGWFIVGIDTPQGNYTYHYEAKDFDLFECEELPVAKHWDGHTEEDVTRLLSLHDAQPRWIPVEERLPEDLTRAIVFCEDGVSFGLCEHLIADDTEVVEWHDFLHYPITPTHWMPLPEPPKEE